MALCGQIYIHRGMQLRMLILDVSYIFATNVGEQDVGRFRLALSAPTCAQS